MIYMWRQYTAYGNTRHHIYIIISRDSNVSYYKDAGYLDVQMYPTRGNRK